MAAQQPKAKAKVYRLKNGHTLDLGQGRAPITGVIGQDKYDELLALSPNFAAEFEEFNSEAEGTKLQKSTDDV